MNLEEENFSQTKHQVAIIEFPQLNENKPLNCRRIKPRVYAILLKQCQQMMEILGMAGHSQHVNEAITTPDTIGQETIKYNSDRLFIEQFISVAMRDLLESEQIPNFSNLLAQHFVEKEYQQQLLQENKIKNLNLQHLSHSVKMEKFEWKTRIEAVSDSLGRVKDLYEDALYENQIKARYVNEWEAARQYQHHTRLLLKERRAEKTLKSLRQNCITENVVHDQIQAYNVAKEFDYAKEIERWREKYDRDTAELILQINKTAKEKDKQQEEFKRISEIYNTQRKEIKAYLVVKEKRAEEEKSYRRKCDAATRIQAWWRGIMVRHGLGPYRRKKGKKGGKSNADAKKENKKKKK